MRTHHLQMTILANQKFRDETLSAGSFLGINHSDRNGLFIEYIQFTLYIVQCILIFVWIYVYKNLFRNLTAVQRFYKPFFPSVR